VVYDDVEETTNVAMEYPLHHDHGVNNRNLDEQDEPDAQHADDTAQQTSNAAMNAQAQVVDNNVQEITNAATEDPLHHDQVVNNRNQDKQHEPDAQHADDTVERTSNAAMDASWPDDALTDSDQETE
jgi:hypothetical protein